MDQQLKVGEPNLDKVSDHEVPEAAASVCEEGNIIDYELHPEANSEFSGAAALEQRRAYKLEIQVYHLCLHIPLSSFSAFIHFMVLEVWLSTDNSNESNAERCFPVQQKAFKGD